MNQIHSKASKPYFHAYHGNTVAVGTVVSTNMITAGQFQGAGAGRVSVIEVSLQGLNGNDMSGPGARMLAGPASKSHERRSKALKYRESLDFD